MVLDCFVFVFLLYYVKKFDLIFDLGVLYRVQCKYKDKCFIFINFLMIVDFEICNCKLSVIQIVNCKDIILDWVDEYLYLVKLNFE